MNRRLKKLVKRDSLGRWEKGNWPMAGGFKIGNNFGPRFNKGYTPWNKGLKNWRKNSKEVGKKISKALTGRKLSEEAKRKMSLAKIGKYTGKNSWNWRGGITPLHNKIRSSIEYRLWQNSVFARDNWTCQKSGIRGGKLVAHHIQNFSKYPELRFAIDNGITLSKLYHEKFHKKYGRKNNTKEQLNKFLCRI